MAGYSLHRNKTIQELLKLHTGFEPKLTNFKPVKNYTKKVLRNGNPNSC